jgi:hypothetical protein
MASKIDELNVVARIKSSLRTILQAIARRRSSRVLFLAMAVWSVGTGTSMAAFRADLQGQNFGTTNWSGGPILGWKELDYVPLRVVFTGGPASNQVMVITFDHTKGTSKGFENFSAFTPSANVIITSAPVLSAPAGSDIWSYTFTVTVINNLEGYVYFLGRLSAGSHGFAGASLSAKVNGTGAVANQATPSSPGKS